MFVKIDALKNFPIFTVKHPSLSLFNKETLTRVFSSEYSEIFTNTFLYRTPPVAASVISVSSFWFISVTQQTYSKSIYLKLTVKLVE